MYNLIATLIKKLNPMKKLDILNLIRYHTEKNEVGFRQQATEIATDFDRNGDHELANHIMALLTMTNTFTPQGTSLDNSLSDAFNPIRLNNLDPLPLPQAIQHDIVGIVNAANRNIGVHTFLFQGAPGTGKTETAKQVARILQRKLYSVNFSTLIDSRLGQSQKNLAAIFDEMNALPRPEEVIILFDEIDSIALDRTNSNDLREMGRVTSLMLKELDKLNNRLVLIATTNLFEHFDPALIRRFDKVVSFDRYTQEDLLKIAEVILEQLLKQCTTIGRDIRLFRKIISTFNPLPLPGDLKNLIRSAIAFSDPDKPYDYLRILLQSSIPTCRFGYRELSNLGLNLREIGLLVGLSKAQISRELSKEVALNE